MANYAKNYTGIYQLKYQSGDWIGTASFRYRFLFGTNPDDGFVTRIGDVFGELAPGFFNNFSYISARIIPANQTESYPWVTPTNGSLVAGAALPFASRSPEDYSFVVNFQGRSGTSRGVVYFGGCSGAAYIANSGSTPWRTSTEEWSVVEEVVNKLNATQIVAPNNQHAAFDPYANFKYNDKLVYKSR